MARRRDAGTGALRRLPSGRYQARIQLDGSMLPAPTTFATKREANAWLAAAVTDQGRGRWVDPRPAHSLTLSEWAEEWWLTKTALKPKTQVGYRSLLDGVILPSWGNFRLDAIKPSAVRAWVAAGTTTGLPDATGRTRTVSPSRIRQAHSVLSQVMSTAVRDGLLATSPCIESGPGRRGSLPPLPETAPTIITRQQARDLVAAAPENYRALFEVLAWCGLRLGEAFALRRRSVDLRRGLLTITESLSDANGTLSFQSPKTYQHRTITIGDGLRRVLSRHIERHVPKDVNSLLFTGSTGQPLRASNFYRWVWQPTLQAAGIERITPHTLRRSVGSWLADDGLPILDVAAYLGHSRTQVTLKHYARSLDYRGSKAGETIEKLRL